MAVDDHRLTALARASILAFSLSAVPAAALAADGPGPAPVAAPAGAAPAAATPATITIVDAAGTETTVTTIARTVADVLAERGISLAPGDAVSPGADAPALDGTRIVVHPAVTVRIAAGHHVRTVRTNAATVGQLLRQERVPVRRDDALEPGASSALVADETIRVVRVKTWTSRVRTSIAPKVVRRIDASLPLGEATIASGRPGVRETVVRVTRREGAAPERTILASHVIREPSPRIVVRGLATYSSLAHVASQGFASAVRMAGSALHMIATAYSAGCYGCSGLTASGVRAGFGVIAVDPSVVPLGTKVFIPGYGRAIAGDTGGAILGHRIDLGFDSETAAQRFGRRPVTLYLLR